MRGYIGYTTCAALNYSFLLQAIYRYMTVMYPMRLFWQSTRFQILLILATWIFSFIYPFEFLFNNGIIYNVDNQICQLPLRRSFSIIYMSSCVYAIPILLVITTYIKLIRYVHQMSKHVTAIVVYTRAQKELKMVRRIVILVMILTFICLPYEIFVLMGMFTSPPQYHFRIAYIFVDSSYTLVIMILFQFTEPVRSYAMKKIERCTGLAVIDQVA
ncbi:unnamed protein product [Adineta ricciae]|uniref:G-protein coupled receptors family 1 profile domain-containing protein n=1 Tax=Adineta ricciae TaxID=249248 RepID=A0A814TES8_ADIRI|nr:unnamed protein product [Adineta ricciae]CAF1437254.1 unnamed protein product [Adineta ricciae]